MHLCGWVAGRVLGVSFIQPTLRPPARSPRELLLRMRLPRPQRGPQTGLRPSPEHPRLERPPASRSRLLRDTRRGPDRILLHMHTHIRTLKPTARTWPSSPFLFRIKPQPYVPASSGHPDQRPPERTTTRTYSSFPSALAPRARPPHGRSHSPDAALATVPGHHRIALRGASARGEKPQPPHRRRNTMSWSRQPGSELRLRVARGAAEPNTHESEDCNPSASQTPLPRGRSAGLRQAEKVISRACADRASPFTTPGSFAY